MFKDKEIKTSIEDDIPSNDAKFINENSSSDLIRAIDKLQSQENMEGNTILTNSQVLALSLMNWASQVYDIEFFKHFVTLFPKYRISGDDGRGRKEIIEIAKAIQYEKAQEHERMLDLLGRK